MVSRKGDFNLQVIKGYVMSCCILVKLSPVVPHDLLTHFPPYDLENVNYCDDHGVPNGKVVHLGQTPICFRTSCLQMTG
jgi:hypothetical protein